MLNKDGVRELAYVVKIDDIKPIAGRDRVESAIVGGWTIMVRKGQFKPGDLGIYFEIDSKLPEKEPFMFLDRVHFKIKTQKYKTPDGHFFSQGLLMGAEDLGYYVNDNHTAIVALDAKDDTGYHELGAESGFLTQELGVTYADIADNKRKANSADKYKLMAQRNPKLFKKSWAKWMMRRNWGKKVMFFFFGKKRDKKSAWPDWVVKTDEERIQNLTGRIPEFCAEDWIATEKIDGTSTTFTMKGYGRKRQFYVCSRNVVFDKPDKKCFYETNVYTEMAEKYNIENILKNILDESKGYLEFVTIQGETYGASIQKRDYSTNDHNLMAFNLIYGFKDGTVKRLNPVDMTEKLFPLGIPCVPIIGQVKLPDFCDGILAMAGGPSVLDGLPREGLVFRSMDGSKSFKAVDNEFLAKYHG